MGNSLAKMCNCTSCGQEENTKDNEEIHSKDPSTKIDTCKALNKPLVDEGLPSPDLSKAQSNSDIISKGHHRILSPTLLPIINEHCSELDDGLNKPTFHQKHPLSNSSCTKGVMPKTMKDNTSNKDNLSINCSKSIDFFLPKNGFFNENVNENWQKLAIYSFVPNFKLISTDPKAILFKGTLNKFVLSRLKKNSSTNVEKFCLLMKDSLNIFKSKESCLLMQKPQYSFPLSSIIGCKRIELNRLNILKLQGWFFFYIDIKAEDMNGDKKDICTIKPNEEDMLRELLSKESKKQFIVLSSYNEMVIDQWVCLINHFLDNQVPVHLA